MLEKTKKIFKLLILMILMSSLSFNSVYAGIGKPSADDTWDLKSKKYTGYGIADNSTLYSNYYFYNANKIKISVTNNKSNKNLKVTVYKKGKLFNVSSVTVPKNGYTEWTITTDGTDCKSARKPTKLIAKVRRKELK